MTRVKRKRRRGGGGGKKKGGVLIGMRSGFKNVTHKVVGAGEQQAVSNRTRIINTVITVVLVALAAWLLYRRYG